LPSGPSSSESASNGLSDPESLSGDEGSDPFLSENISYVKAILRHLIRISLVIRRSGNKYRFEKADATLDERAFEDFRKYLTAIIWRAFEDPEHANLTVEEKIQRASDFDHLTPIQKRLIRANILRRNRLDFEKRSRAPRSYGETVLRRLELGGGPGNEPAAGPRIIDSGPERQPATPSVVVTPPPKTSTIQAVRPGTSTDAATATDVSSKLDVKDIEMRASSGMTRMTRIASSQAYPSSPRLGPGKSLVCPYCSDLLPSEYSEPRHKDSWR
jgi:hypothetical protein